MTRRRLHNDDWGYESNCFVCEQRNDEGLRIPFVHDTEREIVEGNFTLDHHYSGAPSFVHGGVTLAVIDEAQAWATIALGGRFAVTLSTQTSFGSPVYVDREHRVQAWLTDQKPETILTAARVLDPDDNVCAESTATFAVLSEAQARDAIGVDDADLADVADYLRGSGGE